MDRVQHRRTTRGFVSLGRVGEALVCGVAFAVITYLGPFVDEGPHAAEAAGRGLVFGVVWYLVTAGLDLWRRRRSAGSTSPR